MSRDSASRMNRLWFEVLALAIRSALMFALAVWFGGFTFYAGIVIPILHDELGGMEGGAITGSVSRQLNWVGVAALLICWFTLIVERSRWWLANEFAKPASLNMAIRWSKRLRIALLMLTTAILGFLIAFHPIVATHLESDELGAFYRWHQVYLIASSIQWGINLALIAAFLLVWRIDSRD